MTAHDAPPRWRSWLDELDTVKAAAAKLGIPELDAEFEGLYRDVWWPAIPMPWYRQRAAPAWLARHTLGALPRREVPQRSPHDVLVALTPYQSRLRGLIVPVLERMAAAGTIAAVFVPAESRYAAGEVPPGYPIVHERDVAGRDAANEAVREWKLLGARLREALPHLGLPPHVVARTLVFFQAYCWDRAVFRRVLRRVQPRAIYAVHFLERPGYAAAIDELSPRPQTLLAQHGLLNGAFDLTSFRGIDVAMLWGTRQAEMFAWGHGRRVPEFIVTGDPRPRLPAAPAAARSTRGVLFLASPPLPLTRDREAAAIRTFLAAASSGRFNPIIRPHPSEAIADVEARTGPLGEAQASDEALFSEALPRADLVVGTDSTAVLDSVTLGVPVVIIQPSGSFLDWRGLGFSVAEDAAELSSEISRLLDDPVATREVLARERAGMAELFGDADGAADRIAAVIIERARRER